MSVHYPPDDGSSPQPRVNLYLVNPSDCRPSMDRYGRTLERALRYLDPPLDVHTVTPPPWPQHDDGPFSRLAENVGKYRVRYADYPRRVTGQSAAVHHVIDHSYAHLVPALGARRTVVTCHDLMLLRMADGRIPGARGPSWIALLAFRYAVRHLPRAATVVCISQATADDVRHYSGLRSGPAARCALRCRGPLSGAACRADGPPARTTWAAGHPLAAARRGRGRLQEH